MTVNICKVLLLSFFSKWPTLCVKLAKIFTRNERRAQKQSGNSDHGMTIIRHTFKQIRNEFVHEQLIEGRTVEVWFE
jgi:hypothetical protein